MHFSKTLSAVTITLAASFTLCNCSGYRAGVVKPGPADPKVGDLNAGVSDNGEFNRMVSNSALNDSNAMAPNFTADSALKPFCIVKDPAAMMNFNAVNDRSACTVLNLGSAIGASDRLYLQEATSSADEARASVTYVFSKVSPAAANLPESAHREMISSPEVEFSFRCVAGVGTALSFKQVSALFNNQVQFVVVGM